MTKHFWQSCTKVALGVISGCAIAGGVPDQPAQAALFSSTVTVSGTDALGNFVPLANSTFIYNKDQLSPQEFGYTLLSLEASISTPFFTQSYSLADLPTYSATIQTLTTLVPTEYQNLVTKYQGALTNVINRTSGLSSALYDYVGDGDFPPPNATLTFAGQDVPTISLAQLLFPQGGRVTFTSTADGVPVSGAPLEFTPQSLEALLAARVRPLPQALPPQGATVAPSEPLSDPISVSSSGAAAVPEPTTIVGAGLAAGAAAIARRRRKIAA